VKVRDDPFRHLPGLCSPLVARRGDCGEDGRPVRSGGAAP
jgi:hypothetical protein